MWVRGQREMNWGFIVDTFVAFGILYNVGIKSV